MDCPSLVPLNLQCTWSQMATPLRTRRSLSAGRDCVPGPLRGLASRIMERLHSARRSLFAEFRTPLLDPALLPPPLGGAAPACTSYLALNAYTAMIAWL